MGWTDTESSLVRGYARDAGDERPLKGYALVLAGYAGAAGAVALAARLLHRRLPERPAPGDLVLLALATHKLSRLLTKDAVTSPLRAPSPRSRGRPGRRNSTSAPGAAVPGMPSVNC